MRYSIFCSCLRWEPSKKDSGKAMIDITSIREVRPGKTTDMFLSSEISSHFPDECSFSIIHGEGKTLDLIANTADEANVWVTGEIFPLNLIFCCMIGNSKTHFPLGPIFSQVFRWIALKHGVLVHLSIALDEFKGISDSFPFRGNFGLNTSENIDFSIGTKLLKYRVFFFAEQLQ